MGRFLLPVFLFCMVAAATLSFSFVFHANQTLQNDLSIINQAGHFPVPGPWIISSLDRILTAFYSSFFIFLTAGLFVSLTLCLAILIGCLLTKKKGSHLHLHTSGILILLALGVLMGHLFADRSLFHRVRDHVLLPHPAGQAITLFYYAYSPYAVNALAPPLQKPFKTCWIAPDVPEKYRFVSALLKSGWYPVLNKEDTSFLILFKDHQIGLIHKNTPLIRVDPDLFFKNPGRFLRQYSQKTDPARHIRFLCGAGLYTTLPACFFVLVYSLVFRFFCRVFSIRPAIFITVVVVLSAVAGCLWFLYPPPPDTIEETHRMLTSDSLRKRVEALRKIHSGKQVHAFEPYFLSELNRMQIPERYWTAKALATSHSIQSTAMLRKLMDDPSPFVAAAAVRSLSERACDSETRTALMDLIRKNPWWYVQIPAIDRIRTCP